MIKEKNEKFMDIYNDYDYTSFVQFDIFLDLFSEYCKVIIPYETIKEFKLKQLVTTQTIILKKIVVQKQ